MLPFYKNWFAKGDRVRYKGNVYLLGSVDFEEELIGYVSQEDYDSGDYEYSWCRYENCEVISLEEYQKQKQ